MHTNLSSAMVDRSTVIAGYQTYPHVDVYETGMRAGKALFALSQGRSKPAMAWGRRPMLPHVMRQASDDHPNSELQARCRAMERDGALAASVFVGFPHADIPDAGLSAVVVTLQHGWRGYEVRDFLLAQPEVREVDWDGVKSTPGAPRGPGEDGQGLPVSSGGY